MISTSLLILVLLVPACGGDGELSKDTVSSLPDGDATGTALSGAYDLTMTTTACVGTCPVVKSGIFTITFCRVGKIEKEKVTVNQKGGHLEVNLGSSMYVPLMKGGVFADGRFDVGGHATPLGSDVVVTGRAKGTIKADGKLVGTAQMRGSGTAFDTSINCTGSYSVTAQKR